MADTVYEYPNEEPIRGNISFTRFWRGGEDWIQITLISEDTTNDEVHTYASMPFSKFAEAFKACAESVQETKTAWWHDIQDTSKGEDKVE
jgi:hypothetical protein